MIDVGKAPRPHVIGEPERVPPAVLARPRALDEAAEIGRDLRKEEPTLDRSVAVAHPYLRRDRGRGITA